MAVTTPYRRLQQKCKANGVKANGSAAELEARLKAAGVVADDVTKDAEPSKPAPPAFSDYDNGQLLSLWPDGFAGISAKGLFGVLPGWIDPTLAPGTTSQVEQLGLPMTLKAIATLRHMFWSPNLVWFAMAASLHYFAPYDYAAAKEGFAFDWLSKRFAINFTIAFVYYAFFFVGLYVFNLGGRKYLPGSYPTAGNMLHNMWYWSLGIVQWTWWEAVMVRLWATETCTYPSFDEIMNDNKLLAINIFWIFAIPVWRDVHFYIAHRFLHIRAVYTYVHKLHHRNADPEPFSGMTMHPVEHLYYFSNAFTPSLYMSSLSPLIFTWNFIHLTIAPGAGHSGWEDHFQADQYHYVHHAKFECNYGSPMSGCVDQYLGTFREKLGKSKVYTGQWDEANNDNLEADKQAKKKAWSPHGYLTLPETWDHAVYIAFWAALFPLTWYAATEKAVLANHVKQALTAVNLQDKVTFAQAIAAVLAYVPVPFAMFLSKASGDRMSWRWPFQKEKVVGVFGFFLILGWAACILPVYHATLWLLEVKAVGAQ